MSDHRALAKLAKSSEDVRALARLLLMMPGVDAAVAWSDWEIDFLDDMAERDTDEPLSMRQREKLAELRDAVERRSEIDGLGVHALILRCWEERAELEDDDDQAFVESLKASGARTVTRRQQGRLMRCCQQVGLLD